MLGMALALAHGKGEAFVGFQTIRGRLPETLSTSRFSFVFRMPRGPKGAFWRTSDGARAETHGPLACARTRTGKPTEGGIVDVCIQKTTPAQIAANADAPRI